MHREKIFGIHAVKAVLKKYPDQVLRLTVLSGNTNRRLQELVDYALNHSVPVDYCNRRDMDEMVDGENHQGAIVELGRLEVQRHNDLGRFLQGLDHDPLLLILDGVTDPHNLGACMRTANAVGVDAVITTKDRAVGITPIVRKVASGAAEVTPFFQVTNLARTIDQLKEAGVWVFGLSDKAERTVYHSELRGPIAFVMGAEGSGMRRLTTEKCDGLLSIPMLGSVASLNVSVATGVVLYEALRQRKPLPMPIEPKTETTEESEQNTPEE